MTKSTRYQHTTFFPFLSRFLSHWYARFGVSGDSSRGDLERVDVLVPSLASQRLQEGGA